MNHFQTVASEGLSRAGILRTPHGDVETPVFMPVATQAALKGMPPSDLDALGARLILANSYHLYLRPGTEVVAKAGGLRPFMGYEGAILTDSGGFQVLSLSKLRELDDDGVTFTSYLDGSRHRLTPEKVIAIQDELGADIRTTLDECPPFLCGEAAARLALERTMRWSEAGAAEHRRRLEASGRRSLLFPILQGSVLPDLRRRAAEHLAGLGADGACIGGLSVGEPKAMTWETLALTSEALPPELPRYLMGVGTSEDVWDAVAAGADMMDCVYPTRLGRHGSAMTRQGRLNLVNAAFREDFGPLDPDCSCRVCLRHSRAYLRHLFRAQEMSAAALVGYHNLHHLMELMREIRAAIIQGRFAAARAAFKDRRAAAAQAA